MKTKRTLRKFFYAFFIILAVLNISTIFIWKLFYFNPKLEAIEKQEEKIYEKLNNKEYDTYEELVKELDKIPGITYSIESEENIISSNSKKDIHSNIFSELIKIDNQTYLLKIYNNETLEISQLTLGFLKIHIIVAIAVAILSMIVLNSELIIPIRKLIDDMQAYKDGKKPKKYKNTNNEISALQNEFISLTEALENEKQEQHRIIASISHDLKTPLTSVIGYSNLMNETTMDKEQLLKYNNKINNKAKAMKDILNSFDEYLVNNNSGKLNFEKIKIEELINQIIKDYEFDLNNISIKLEIESNCNEEYINIDLKKIKRVIANIIDNSVRYIKNKGLIKIKIELINEYYHFSISDNGRGVDEKIISKIFDPLFTTDNSRKISGLGLSICKEFIEMHKGTIKAYNNKGLTIEFTIPKEFIEE